MSDCAKCTATCGLLPRLLLDVARMSGRSLSVVRLSYGLSPEAPEEQEA